MNNDSAENRMRDFFYSAMMLNSEVTYKTLKDLTDKKVIKSYRELNDIGILKRIADSEFDLNQDTEVKIRKMLDSYNDIVKIAKRYSQIACANSIEVISCLDKGYPYNWKNLSGMPKVFYCRGRTSLIDSITLGGSVAVVGSRSPSKYAQYATDKICRELGDKGITIVSGMAYGIDRQAHISSVNTKGGTIAVLAGGVDNIYPPKNKDIYDLILSNGLIISEMPPGQQPLRQYFPSRNRLIAGLSDCTLILEAGEVSGKTYYDLNGQEVVVDEQDDDG